MSRKKMVDSRSKHQEVVQWPPMPTCERTLELQRTEASRELLDQVYGKTPC